MNRRRTRTLRLRVIAGKKCALKCKRKKRVARSRDKTEPSAVAPGQRSKYAFGMRLTPPYRARFCFVLLCFLVARVNVVPIRVCSERNLITQFVVRARLQSLPGS